VLGGYIMGVVMMEVGAMFSAGTSRAGAPAGPHAMHSKLPDEAFARLLPADTMPCLAAALPHLAGCDPDEQFEFGLDLLLAGIASRVHVSA
jgi:hypothetical protein